MASQQQQKPELFRVFEQRDLKARSEARFPASLLKRHNDMLERIAEPVGETADECRADLIATFGQWIDLMVRHKSFVDEDPEFKEDMKRILLEMYADPDQRAMLPPFDWHYWQLFRETLPEVNSDKEKVVAKELFVIHVDDDDDSSDNELPLDAPTFAEFLGFITYFVRDEFGEDRVVPIRFDTRFGASGLCFDEVAYVNMASALESEFPATMRRVFDSDRIPDAFFNAFGGDPDYAVGDLYDDLW